MGGKKKAEIEVPISGTTESTGMIIALTAAILAVDDALGGVSNVIAQQTLQELRKKLEKLKILADNGKIAEVIREAYRK